MICNSSGNKYGKGVKLELKIKMMMNKKNAKKELVQLLLTVLAPTSARVYKVQLHTERERTVKQKTLNRET